MNWPRPFKAGGQALRPRDRREPFKVEAMERLTLTSCMSPNTEFIGEHLARFLSDRLPCPVSFVNDMPWQERERRFDLGEIQICWICGLPYIWKADQDQSEVALLTAPVMKAARYQGLPVYFSDVIVHRDSPFWTFEDLRGASWAYNEPRSHSGYNLTRYYLAKLGKPSDFFGSVIESGAHEISIAMILDRQVEAFGIDSIVLEVELQKHPDYSSQIRTIETFGPSPIPPWVIHKSVPEDLRAELKALLSNMPADPAGRELLAEAGMARFVVVEDGDYDPIREMARVAARVTWPIVT